MSNYDFETLGYYEPGFLHLRVNTDLPISDLNELASNKDTAKEFSTFLHEYVHFLQEIATTSGLLRAHLYVNTIKEFNWIVRNDRKTKFQVPIDFSNENNIKANFDLLDLYDGGKQQIERYIKYIRYEAEPTHVMTNGGKKTLNKYFIYYRTSGYELKKLHFGSRCLKEYVAHTIQKKFFPATEHPDIPYMIAELIITSEYPSFGDDPLLIASLCDASLMHFHPSQLFFDTIERMKAMRFIPKSSRDVYDFVLNDLRLNGEMGSGSMHAVFSEFSSQTDKQFQDALAAPYFQPNYIWLAHILKEARALRQVQPDFMSLLVQGERKLSSLCFEIFRNIGTPFFTNNHEHGMFIPPETLRDAKINPFQLLVFKQVLSVYRGSSSCELFNFCKLSSTKGTEITNEHCKSSPWKRATESELCPFGQIWKTWGLTGEEPCLTV